MQQKRHRWDTRIIVKVVDAGIATCMNCGMLKQYVKGKPFYWKNDNANDKAPPCQPEVPVVEPLESSKP